MRIFITNMAAGDSGTFAITTVVAGFATSI